MDDLFKIKGDVIVMNYIQEYADQIPCLMYHVMFRDNENTYKENPFILSVEKFEEQMSFLYHNGFSTITLDELEKYIKNEIKISKRSVVISFDDGAKCSYIYAYPILKKYSFNAVNFLITSKIRTNEVTFDPPHTQFLSWREINQSKDVFEFACHTNNLHTHDSNGISRLISEPRDFVINDLICSLELIKTKYFSYPFGAYNKDVIKILQELGFTMAFNVTRGFIKPLDNMFMLKRTSITSNTTIEEFKKIIGFVL